MKKFDIEKNVSKNAYEFFKKNFDIRHQDDGGCVLTEVSMPSIEFIFIFPDGKIKVNIKNKVVVDFDSLQDAVDFIMI
ncbi:MAG: hypothetical protein LBF04_00905 [Prevotellaceae bacterium]|jgi:hypothetical protein|nr:hypothetical protein [Prevotellaceae bacterium]